MFVAQREDGVWDVVDGVQRLSSILQFLGVLKDRGSDDILPPEPLVAGEYLSSLSGIVFDEVAQERVDTAKFSSGTSPLDEPRQRDFLRGRVSIQIIEKASDPFAKYDLFQRLNSGARLSEQEIRNCLTVMLDESFYDWLATLADYGEFNSVTAMSERKVQEQYPTELVLRYLAGVHASTTELSRMDDVSSFLDEQVRAMATSATCDRELEATNFRATFDLLNDALGDTAFRRWDGSKHVGPFSIACFEVLAVGLALNLSAWKQLPPTDAAELLAGRARSIWSNEIFAKRSGSGQRGSYRMPALVELGQTLVVP